MCTYTNVAYFQNNYSESKQPLLFRKCDIYGYNTSQIIREYASTLYVGMARKKWPPIHFNCK